MRKRIVILLFMTAAVGGVVWAVVHFRAAKRNRVGQSAGDLPHPTTNTDPEAWNRAVEKVKADRSEAGGNGAVEIPTELRLYSDRYWFLAAQVAEVEK